AEQKAEEEAAAQAAAEQKAEEEAAAKVAAEEESGQWMSVEATAYSRNQPSLSNFTFLGIDLRENPRVIAVDPDVIPLESRVYIPGYGEFIAGDTGGAIIGNRIDLHMENVDDAWAFGRQQLDIQILD
ncbi:3D (Asp-Asp-Asp) domain-containing protein, partial [Alkalibacterium subtropicum]